MEAESLHVIRKAGVEIIVAIDSTVLGPALGGCRWQLYPDAGAARRDALELARAMTRKAALAGLALGGGKMVVVGDPSRRTREQLLAAGDFVESLGGRYVTAADMGTSQAEMAVIRERTEHVVGLPRELGGCGDPGPFTAVGVHLALETALAHVGRALPAATVAIQGVGSVGGELARRLVASGASVIAADPAAEKLAALPPEVRRVPPHAIMDEDCDAFAPCGPPGVIDAARAERLDCRVVCGGANNPLVSLDVAKRLAQRGILYVPDFLSNAGGLIHLAVFREGGDVAASLERLRVIPENLTRVLERAERDRTDMATAAERAAMERLARADASGRSE